MHFWISRINLFRNFKHHRLSELEVMVKKIRKNPARFISSYTYTEKLSCLAFQKDEKAFSCFGYGFARLDLYLKDTSKKLRNNMSEEAAADEGNHRGFTNEEAPLNIDSYPVRSYGSFSQKENL